MARKRKSDEPEGGVGIADPPSEHTPAVTQPDEPVGEPAAALPAENGGQPAGRNRPAASFAAFSDRTTRIGVACWARQVKVSETEEYIQYALTVSRSWRDKDGQWTQNTSYRAHDVPVLLCLVTQAYQWCVAQRTQVRVETDGEVPF